MFGHKTIYKVTNLKVHSKGRYLIFLNYFSRTTKLFSCICDITPPTEIKMVGGWGELLVEHCTFENQNPVRVFLYHCIYDGNQMFSENFGCHVQLILHIMFDKTVFVSGALFWVQRYQGNLELSHSNSASRWHIINLHIYAATNRVSLWDYSINKLNCVSFTAINVRIK